MQLVRSAAEMRRSLQLLARRHLGCGSDRRMRKAAAQFDPQHLRPAATCFESLLISWCSGQTSLYSLYTYSIYTKSARAKRGAGAQRSRLHRTTSLARSACPTVRSSWRRTWNAMACRRGSAIPAGDCISWNVALACCFSVAMSSARCGMSVLFSATNAATAAAAARNSRSLTASTSSAADLCSALPAMKRHCTKLPTRRHQMALKVPRRQKL